jgi:hypothetical protein
VIQAPSSTDDHPVSVDFHNKAFHVTSSSGSFDSFSTLDIVKITKVKQAKAANHKTNKTSSEQELEKGVDSQELLQELETQAPVIAAPQKKRLQQGTNNKPANPYAAKATKPAAAAAAANNVVHVNVKDDYESEEENEMMDFDAMSSNPIAAGSKKSSFVDVDAESVNGGDGDESHASYEDVDKDVAGLKLKRTTDTAAVAAADGNDTNAFDDTFDGAFENDNYEGGDDKDVTLSSSAFAHNNTAMVAQAQQEPPQEAFAPSSTPVNVEHAHMRRILCWNHMGVITSRRDEMDDEQHMVDINLNDATLAGAHKNFMDAFGFDQASLGEDGAMFATYNGTGDDDEDDGNAMLPSTNNNITVEGSKLFFFRFDTIGAQKRKDWSATLAAGEHALGVACGEGWAAVATSRRMLRLFTSGGIQRIIMCLKGDPVTIVGRGRLVAVFYHLAAPLTDKTQQLGYTLFDAMEGTAIHEGHVTAVQKGQSLTWAGFSNDLSLVVMESSGLVSMLSSAAGWQWVPVLDTLGKKKSSEDSFWPVSVLHGKFVCVPLKGGHEHPDATRRPVTTSMELRLPLAQGMKKTCVTLIEYCTVWQWLLSLYQTALSLLTLACFVWFFIFLFLSTEWYWKRL